MNPRRNAIVTASYAGDLERFELLCDSIDRQVTGFTRHYVLVAGHDVRRFRRFESPRRLIIDERDILPGWLRPFRDPVSLFRRHIWLSLRTPPIYGWHVQQLRRIALAGQIDEDAMFACDSDVVFVKPFDCTTLWYGDDLRFFKRPNALAGTVLYGQREWSQNAAVTLGLPVDPPSVADYIATAVAWRRDCVLSMCERIEKVHGGHWAEAIAATRAFSECMIYGRFVDEIRGGRSHRATEEELCRVYWFGPRLDESGLVEFIDGMAPGQVAIGIQSFLGMDPARIRRFTGLA